MNHYDRQAYNAALRSDFRTFLHRCVLTLNPGAIFFDNWHLEAIAYQLDRVRKGEETRLIINMPPRYLKSITVTVAFTAYVLGLNPKLRIFSIFVRRGPFEKARSRFPGDRPIRLVPRRLS